MKKIYYGKIRKEIDINQVITDLINRGCSIRKQYKHLQRFITFSGEIGIDILKKVAYFEMVDEIFDITLHGLSENNRSFNTYYNWGLDRISKPSPILMKNYDATRTGLGVQLYVMDTGIMMSHYEFNGNRVYPLYDAWRDEPQYPDWRWWANDPSPYTDPIAEANFLSSDSAYYGWPGTKPLIESGNYVPDDHGTHVAAIAAGQWCGVASQVTVWSVRIFNGNVITTNEHVMDGVDTIIAKHLSMNPSMFFHDLSTIHLDVCGVVNMSFGGPSNSFWDSITNAMITKGLVVVVSAGNNSQCASAISPASAGTTIDLVTGILTIDPTTKPIVVGSSLFPGSIGDNYPDVYAAWSNWGDCIDVVAPGDNIVSASFDLLENNVATWDVTNQYRQRTGSSQSAPFVSGVVCMMLEYGSTLHGPDGVASLNDQIRKQIIEYSYKDMFAPQSMLHMIDGKSRNTPNNFLYSYYLNTDIVWDDGNIWELTASSDEGGSCVFEASSLDPFGLNVRIDYTVSNMTQYLQTSGDILLPFDYVYKTVKVSTDKAGFFEWQALVLLGPPITSIPITYGFDIIASDERRTIQKRVLVNVLASGISLVWNYPEAGLLTPLDSRYPESPYNPGIMISNDPENETYVTQNVYQSFSVSDVNLSAISYQVIPSLDYLPPGLTFSVDSTNNIAIVQGPVGVIPKTVTVYNFVIRATNPNNLIIDRSFYFQVQPTNLLHQFDPSWLEQMGVDDGYEVQQNDRVYYIADVFQGGQINVELIIDNPDNDVLKYQMFKLYATSKSDGTTNLDEWDIQYVPTPYYDSNCNPNTSTCYDRFTENQYYTTTPTQVIPTPLTVYDGVLPDGISLTTDGFLTGVVNLDANVGLYYFKIMASDAVYGVTNFDYYDQITASFRIQVNPITFAVIQEEVINWITAEGSIGDIWEMYPSHLYVAATTIGTGTIEYAIQGTALPSGLSLNIWSGYIIGIAPSITITQVVKFIVRASVKTNSGIIFSDRNFSFTVHQRFAVKNFLNCVFPVMGTLRKSIMKSLWINKYISVSDLFQPSAFDYINDSTFAYGSDIQNYKEDFVYPSPVFGIVRYPSIYVAAGLKYVDPNLLINYMQNYQHRIKLVLGNLQYAVANDLNGNEIYNVIYFDVIDMNAITPTSNMTYTTGFDANNKEVESTYPYILTSQHSTFWNVNGSNVFFEQSIRNMRLDLLTTTNRLTLTTQYNGIGLAVGEMLPTWMESVQSNGSIPGFKLAMPVAYVLPGKGLQVLNSLKTKNFDKSFLGSEIDINGYVISGMGFGYDANQYILGTKYFNFS